MITIIHILKVCKIVCKKSIKYTSMVIMYHQELYTIHNSISHTMVSNFLFCFKVCFDLQNYFTTTDISFLFCIIIVSKWGYARANLFVPIFWKGRWQRWLRLSHGFHQFIIIVYKTLPTLNLNQNWHSFILQGIGCQLTYFLLLVVFLNLTYLMYD